MGRGAFNDRPVMAGPRSTIRPKVRTRPPRRWISLHGVPGDGPVDVFGKALPSVSRPDLESVISQASASNLRIPVYKKLVVSCGVDRFYLAAGDHPEDPDILATHDYGRTTVFETVLDRYLTQPVIEEPAPGLRNGNVLGLAAMLRHEHAHELWNRLERNEAEFACAVVPRDAEEISSGLTVYAGESFGDSPIDESFLLPSRRFVETFCECFEVASHPAFDPERFPGWVGETWTRIRELL